MHEFKVIQGFLAEPFAVELNTCSADGWTLVSTHATSQPDSNYPMLTAIFNRPGNPAKKVADEILGRE